VTTDDQRIAAPYASIDVNMIVAKKIAMNFCRSIPETGSYVFLDVLAFEFVSLLFG